MFTFLPMKPFILSAGVYLFVALGFSSCETCVTCVNCYQLYETNQNNTGVGKICEGDYKSVNTYGNVIDSLRQDGCICD